MTFVNENIKYLRKQNGWTQEQFSQKIGIKRSLLGAYEEGRAEPGYTNLLNISKIFGKSVDTLLTHDLKNNPAIPSVKKDSNEEGFKVLAITVDKQEKENIELVPQKAAAGYLNGFADPEYIQALPKFQLPMLNSGTFRAFEITGDSMLPLKSGTIVIGKYLENVTEVKNGKTYVLVTRQEGVVYKRVFNYISDHGKLHLVSDNKAFSPYNVSPEDVLEIWEAKAYISIQFPDPKDGEELSIEKLTSIVLDLQQEVIKLKKH
ncbi:MAG TPA: LexA family transcriptional regulator [Cytophagales bacterium]|nr:LexA family transcriptional regulator [Cytophagales bacterium]